MGKCVICDKDSGKGKTCSSTCRSRLARSVATVKDATPINATVQEPSVATGARPMNWGLPDCECKHCQTNQAHGNKHTINHGEYKPAAELGPSELNRVAKPGDVDYVGVCNAEDRI